MSLIWNFLEITVSSCHRSKKKDQDPSGDLSIQRNLERLKYNSSLSVKEEYFLM